MAQHDHVRRHRLEIERRVSQRLAFHHARRSDGDVQRVGAQPLLRDFKRGAGARARLEEQVDDGLAAQRRHLLDRPRADFLHRLGGVQHERDFRSGQVGDASRSFERSAVSGRGSASRAVAATF